MKHTINVCFQHAFTQTPTQLLMGFPGSGSGKEPACQCRRQERWVRSLGWEDTLEEGKEIHSSILAWRIPWTEDSGRLWSLGSQRFRHNWSSLVHTQTPTDTRAPNSYIWRQLLSWCLWYKRLLQHLYVGVKKQKSTLWKRSQTKQILNRQVLEYIFLWVCFL